MMNCASDVEQILLGQRLEQLFMRIGKISPLLARAGLAYCVICPPLD
jgi:hypothetical protein